MFHIDRIILPVSSYTSATPPYVPSVRVEQDYLSIVPAMAIAIANRISTIATNSPATIGTYNAMSSRGWNNDFFTTSVEVGMWLLTKSLKTREFPNSNSATPHCAKLAVGLAIGMFYERYPNLDGFLKQDERPHVKKYLTQWLQLRLEMEPVLSRLDNIIHSAPTQTTAPKAVNTNALTEKEITMSALFTIVQNGHEANVLLTTVHGTFQIPAAQFPDCGGRNYNVQYRLTDNQIVWLQNNCPEVLYGRQSAPVHAPVHHGSHVVHPQHAVHHTNVAPVSVASVHGASRTATISHLQPVDDRYADVSLGNTPVYPEPNRPAHTTAQQPAATQTVVEYKYPEPIPMEIRDKGEEINILRYGPLGSLLHSDMPAEIVDDIKDMITGGTDVPIYQTTHIQDAADYLRNSKKALENRLDARMVRIVEGFRVPAVVTVKEVEAEAENGDVKKEKDEVIEYPVGTLVHYILNTQSEPLSYLNNVLRTRNTFTFKHTPEVHAGMCWLDSVLTRRAIQILRNVFDFHIAFDSYSEDHEALYEALAEQGKSAEMFRLLMENVISDILSANTRAPDSEIAEYAEMNGVDDKFDLVVASERTSMVYLPILSQQLGWDIGYTPRRIDKLEDFPLARLLTKIFQWISKEYGIESPMHYMTTRDGVVYRFARPSEDYKWVVTRIN